MTSDEILKNKKITFEKKVYGFVYILLLFSRINKIIPSKVIELMGSRYKIYILCGWGDLNQNKTRTILEWQEELNIQEKFELTEELCDEISLTCNKICDEIFIEKEKTELKYIDIIKNKFSNYKTDSVLPAIFS